jgi:dCTP deaminase
MNIQEGHMHLLSDSQLVQKLTGQNPMIEGLVLPTDCYSSDSPVQAASIDLHIGNIFVPGKSGPDEGSQDRPKTLHTLRTGETSIVTTLETLRLPENIAAIGFPPSHVSFQGLLMTNPGHIDPGYEGLMRFTVINMGKADYVLRRNDGIVTLLFFELPDVQMGWKKRHQGKTGGLPNQADLDRLSYDFMGVSERASQITSKKVNKARIWLTVWGILATVIVTTILGIATFFLNRFSGMDEIKQRLTILEKSSDVNRIERKTDDLDRRLKLFEGMSPVPGIEPVSIPPAPKK